VRPAGGKAGRTRRSAAASVLAPITAPPVDPRDRAHPARLLSALIRAPLTATLIAYEREMTLDKLRVGWGDGLTVDLTVAHDSSCVPLAGVDESGFCAES
jgi:hypothetical protein